MKGKVSPLRLAILENGCTQREIAAKAGIHESIISLVVNGRYIPDERQRRNIAIALGRYEDELFPESLCSTG
jgi:transcriptional regulator with XRE-family HTH domain